MNDLTTLDWLTHARDHAAECQTMVAGLALSEFERDRRTQSAVCFCLIIVGEALNHVPKDVHSLAPDLPWVPIVALRNRLVHAYWLTDLEAVLRISQADLVPLTRAIDRLRELIK